MADQSDPPPTDKWLETIDRATLTPLVRRALDRQSCEIVDWDYGPVYGGVGEVGAGRSGIYRFAGKGRDQGETVSCRPGR